MDVRTRILRAAAELYGESGFRGATTRRIAERAGVNEITLFRQFGSKTRLLHEAIRCTSGAPQAAVLPSRPANPRTELLQWATASHCWLLERRSLLRSAMGDLEERPELLPPDRSPTVCAGMELSAYVARLQEAGLARSDVCPQTAATLLMGALFADAISRDILSGLYPEPPDASVRQYVDLFIRALGLEEGHA
jgi:AcrR family transcriptional regulator